jgi:hypothetical protein
MRRLVVFNNVSLDGYFVDANGDMSWAHKQGRSGLPLSTRMRVAPPC